MKKKKIFKQCGAMFLAAAVTATSVLSGLGEGVITAKAGAVAVGSGSYSTEVVGQYSYSLNGSQVYVDNATLLDKLPYKGSAYRYTTDHYDATNSTFDTTNWATSFMWDLDGDEPFSSQVYAIPFAFKGEDYGLQVTAPSSLSDVANHVYNMQMAEDGTLTDFFVKTGFTSTSAKVDAVTDWSYDIVWEDSSDAAKQMKATLVQGVPFVYFQMSGTDTLTFERGRTGLPSAIVAESEDGSYLIARCYDNGDEDYDYYAFYAAKGTNWTIDKTASSIKTLTAALPSGRAYVSMAYLGSVKTSPDDTWAIRVGKEFGKYAYNYITDTKAEYSYNETESTVTTTYTYTFDKKEESTADGTVMGILPHQYKNMPDASYAAYTYQTVRGTMKTIIGSTFTTELTYSGILPYMPEISDTYSSTLSGYLTDYTDNFGGNYFNNYEGSGDTYWDGKGLNRLANAMIAAENAGDTATANEMLEALKTHLEDWFTYSGSSDKRYFYYDDKLGTLFGFPQSYNSVDQINDHHFHYGYFIYAAAQVALRVDNWGDDNKYGKMVKELIYDIACPDRNSSTSRYPYLRSFAPYEGHSWASGHQNFGMGNNQESSSEALNAWAGIILFGEATGDEAIRDLGVYLYSTEVSAVNNYWFDVDENVLSDAYRYGVTNKEAAAIDKETAEVKYNSAAIVWGGSYCYATWFSANPMHIQGINLLPMNPTGFYLAGNKDYITENIRLAYKYAKQGGFNEMEWFDIWCEYQALADPQAAMERWEAQADSYSVEGGETKAHTYQFIRSLIEHGTPDTSITSDTALSTVFVKDGVKTYAAYNAEDTAKTVTFSDGAAITARPHTLTTVAQDELENVSTYQIEYYKQNAAGTGYEKEVVTKQAMTGKTVNAGSQKFTGFTFDASNSANVTSGTVTADGSLVLKVYYTRNTYEITYHLDGGSWAEESPSVYRYGSEITFTVPVKTGYVFDGWYRDSAFTTAISGVTAATSGNLDVYAKWTDPNKYELEIGKTIECDGSNLIFTVSGMDSTASVLVYYNLFDSREAAEAVTSDAGVAGFGGHTLNWMEAGSVFTCSEALEAGSAGKWLAARFNVIVDGVGILSKWGVYEIPSEDTGAVTYQTQYYKENAQGGYSLAETVTGKAAEGSTVTAQAKTYTGYTLDSENAGQVTSGTVLAAQPLVLKLYYKRNTYTITYHLDGGTAAENPDSYRYGDSITLKDPSKDGYVFAGWYLNPEFTGNKITAISSTSAQNLELYAKWSTQSGGGESGGGSGGESGGGSGSGEYTRGAKGIERDADGNVILYVNGTTQGAMVAFCNVFDTKEDAEAITSLGGLPGYNMTKVSEGVFEYNLGKVDSSKYIVYAFNNGVQEEVVAIAVSEIPDATGGSSSGGETTATYRIEHYKENEAGDGYILVDDDTEEPTGIVGETKTATAKGYTGFTYDAAGSSASGKVTADGQLVLKLYYKRNSYAIHYECDGGNNSNPSAYRYGVGLTLQAPAKEGYTFAGWYDNADHSGNPVTAIGTDRTGEITLYAKWEKNAVAVTGVTLNKTILSLKKGASEKLTVQITPANADNTQVEWSTSDATVAAVAADGTVTALKEGTAVITVTTKDGAKTADCEVTVTADTQGGGTESGGTDDGKGNGGTESGGTESGGNSGTTNTYTVTFNTAGGSAVAAQTVKEGALVNKPADPTRKGYTFAGWYAGNNAYNFAAPVKGNLTLTAKWTQIKVTKIKLTGISKQIAAGKKIKLKATVTPATAANRAVTWKTSNKKYATVNSKGVVTMKKAGAGKTVVITATAKDGSGRKATYRIKIMKKAVKKITLKAKTTKVKAGKKVSIKATVIPTKNVNKKLIYKTSNKKYATVNSKGVVTTKKAGKGKIVKITATATDGSGKKATIKIKIR